MKSKNIIDLNRKKSSTITQIIIAFILLVGTQSSFAQTTKDSIPTNQPEKKIATDVLSIDMLSNDLYTGDVEESATEEGSQEEVRTDFWKKYIFNPMRIGISYEFTYKFTQPDEVIKNRLAFRMEYSKFLWNNVFVQVDTKAFTFLNGDSRSRDITLYLNDSPKQTEFALGSITRNAFVQYSYKQLSFKAGIQTLAWGESDFAAITDEINPFDFRDPLNLNIDELRLGQFMVAFDWFTSFGNWSAFLVPDARFNKLPQKGTRFYIDPFEGMNVELQNESNDNTIEYGIRWKKAFAKSDVSFIATSLINNDLVYERLNSEIIQQKARRFTTLGMSFNYAIKNFLIRGEGAVKFPKTYNNAMFEVIEKNAIDTSLGLEYTYDSTFTLAMELVNNHVVNWSDDIVGTPRNNFTAFFVLTKQLMKNNLSLNYVSMYTEPYSAVFNLLSSSYKWNDNVTVSLDMILPTTKNINSGFYVYRNQQQLAFKIQYQF